MTTTTATQIKALYGWVIVEGDPECCTEEYPFGVSLSADGEAIDDVYATREEAEAWLAERAAEAFEAIAAEYPGGYRVEYQRDGDDETAVFCVVDPDGEVIDCFDSPSQAADEAHERGEEAEVDATLERLQEARDEITEALEACDDLATLDAVKALMGL